MYNGIGVSTARGTGTNGYIQRNFSALKPRNDTRQSMTPESHKQQMERELHRKPNAEILEHERKRQIEVKCFELRDELENEG